MPGGKSGLFPGIEKHHQSDEYKQWKAEEDLLREVGRDRLVELAKAEKDGRLVVLPCKVGDKVWIDGSKAIVEEFFGYKTERYLQAQFYDNMQYIDVPFDDFGKTVFLTREEAEAAMKTREADNG